MKVGALALIPSRRSWMTCPISWTNRSTTIPSANVQPQKSEYAATDTSAVPAVVSSLSFGSSSSAPLIAAKNFATTAAIAAAALPSRRRAARTRCCLREGSPNALSPSRSPPGGACVGTPSGLGGAGAPNVASLSISSLWQRR